MQEQETVDVMVQETIVEGRKEWQAPKLRSARIDLSTQQDFAGSDDGGLLS